MILQASCIILSINVWKYLIHIHAVFQNIGVNSEVKISHKNETRDK